MAYGTQDRDDELAAVRRELEKSRQIQRELELELAIAREEMQAAVGARDEFITVAAHELRNPLAAIVLYVQNLILSTQRDKTACSDEIKSDLIRLEMRINEFVKRAGILLDLTRLTSGNFSLEVAEVNMTQLAERVAGDFAEQARRAECKIELDLAPNVVGLWDSLAIEQVVVNLISNAIKYGAGHPVRIRLRADEHVASFQVEDRGIGISEESQARIFDKFERAVRKNTHGGFGVGLWITNQVVRALGGEIVVDSKPGLGSTFSVSLPRRAGGE